MTKPILTLALALAAAPTLAAPTAHVVAGDHGPISYTRELRPDGTVLLASAPQSHGLPFRLVVRGNIVSGEVDGRPVSFRAPRPRAAARAD